jgi:RelE toxin of RelE / RelB toxin-antitoxin system
MTARERADTFCKDIKVNRHASKPLVSNGIQFVLDLMVSNGVQEIVQTVVETPTYLAIANKLFSEEERADIVALVAADPECGDVIRGTGGFRKVRVARKGMGKSGGARVVYIWRNERFPVFLITVFPKNEKENLSMAERNALKKRADSIFETYGR